MKSTKWVRCRTYGALICVMLVCCWLFVLQYGIFGSSIDWISQHSVLPGYFRERFYATGNLLPEFAWNLGGGQNIYCFAYYGLFSPQVLLSYLFPFIPMDLWIMGTSMAGLCISVVLFCKWQMDKGMRYWTCVLSSLIFGLAAPLLYHSYNQLMFVNYMPYLVLAFWGVDRHFEKRRSGVLAAAVMGMVLTSFYFSIGGLIGLTVYGIAEYLKREERVTARSFLGESLRYAFPVLTGILLAGILLIPAAAALFGGRTGAGQASVGGSRGIAELLTDLALWIPDFLALRLFYTPYGVGLSSFALTVLLRAVLCGRRWKEKIVPTVLLIFLMVPVFGYLLNGGLYSKDKVFIPFLPLICAEIAHYVENIPGEGKSCGKELLPYGVTLLLLMGTSREAYFSEYWHLGMLDGICMAGLYLAWNFLQKKRKQAATGGSRKAGVGAICWPVLGTVGILFVTGWFFQYERNVMISRESYAKLTDERQGEAIRDILEEDDGWYRTEQYGSGEQNLANVNRIWEIGQNVTTMYSSAYNGNYKAFREDTMRISESFRNDMMQTAEDNPLFYQLMGVKYVLSDEQPEGYELYKDLGAYRIFRAEQAAPFAYVTDRVMPQSEYEHIGYPENQAALSKRAVVPDAILDGKESEGATGEGTKEEPLFHSCTLSLPEIETDDLTIQRTQDGYEIDAASSVTVKAALEGQRREDNLLAVSFSVENKKPGQDMFIRLERQTNRLTAKGHIYANHNDSFDYLISLPEGSDEVTLHLGKGRYVLHEFAADTAAWDPEESRALYQWPVRLQGGTTAYRGGDGIRGSVSAETDGYLITSIPYDEHFSLLVDGRETELFRVNTAFLGARIPAGVHQISLEYHAPGHGVGLALSILGILMAIAGKVSSLFFAGAIDNRRRSAYNRCVK